MVVLWTVFYLTMYLNRDKGELKECNMSLITITAFNTRILSIYSYVRLGIGSSGHKVVCTRARC
jgi:hypothetical protein